MQLARVVAGVIWLVLILTLMLFFIAHKHQSTSCEEEYDNNTSNCVKVIKYGWPKSNIEVNAIHKTTVISDANIRYNSIIFSLFLVPLLCLALCLGLGFNRANTRN